VHPSDLAFSQALGLRPAPGGAEHLLELPHTSVTQNHVGTVHAAAQFALAESASAVCLQREFPDLVGQVFAVVRGAQLKYRRATTSTLHAFARLDDTTRENLAADLATRRRASATVLVDLKDSTGQLVFAGSFDWFIAREAPRPES
jgi:acyl-coenzyme A thioesterase PaaI-like protein